MHIEANAMALCFCKKQKDYCAADWQTGQEL
jgi:hypothetical protein